MTSSRPLEDVTVPPEWICATTFSFDDAERRNFSDYLEFYNFVFSDEHKDGFSGVLVEFYTHNLMITKKVFGHSKWYLQWKVIDGTDEYQEIVTKRNTLYVPEDDVCLTNGCYKGII